MNAALEWLTSGKAQRAAELEHLKAELELENRKFIISRCFDRTVECDDEYILFLKRQIDKRELALMQFEDAIKLIMKEIGNEAFSP